MVGGGGAGNKYTRRQNIMGILKSVFKIPPLPLYNVANR